MTFSCFLSFPEVPNLRNRLCTSELSTNGMLRLGDTWNIDVDCCRWGHTAKDDAKIFGHNDVAAMIEQAEKCKGHFTQKMENVSPKK